MAHAVRDIQWKHDLDAELKGADTGHHVLLDFSAAPM
jgi:hypothetical protein